MIITVPAGASLWSLAQAYYGNGLYWPVIYQANPQLTPDPALVIAGQQIEIPEPAQKNSQLALYGLAATAEGLLVLATAAVLSNVPTLEIAVARLDGEYLEARFAGPDLPGLPVPALRAALAVAMAFPPERIGATGPATRTVMLMNLVRRAQFVVSATQRIAAAIRDAYSRGGDVLEAYYRAAEAERRYYAQHLLASWGRMDAAARVDSAAGQYGLLLGWNAEMDRRTSAECRHADGKNFLADAMPLIGYPGMVHPHCRCFPSRPFPGAPILPSAGRRLTDGNPAPDRRIHRPVPAVA